jgi:hypothetical protein
MPFPRGRAPRIRHRQPGRTRHRPLASPP